MKSSFIKKITYVSLAAALVISSLSTQGVHKAAKKASLSSKNIKLTVGSKMTVAIKNRNKKAKYTYSSSKRKVASVTKKGVITGRTAGTAKITVKEKLGKSVRKLGIIKVTVKKATSVTATTCPDTIATPTATAPVSAIATTTPATPTEPAATESPAPTRTPLVLDDTSTPSDFNVKKDGVAYGNYTNITYHSGVTGTDRHAIVLTPPDYDTSVSYPVLYLCHGGNGDENDWKGGQPDYIYGNLLESGDTVPMIMVLVNCRARANDGANPSDSLTDAHMKAWADFLYELQDDLMPYMEANYPILTGRENTAIAGFSMGGRESLYIGFNIPDKIKYIGAFSPAFGIFEYTNFGYYEKGYFTEETFTLPDEYMDNTTCMIMNGENDGMVRDEPECYHNALVANNVNHYYYTMPGDHNMDVWRNGLYNFLKVVFK